MRLAPLTPFNYGGDSGRSPRLYGRLQTRNVQSLDLVSTLLERRRLLYNLYAAASRVETTVRCISGSSGSSDMAETSSTPTV